MSFFTVFPVWGQIGAEWTRIEIGSKYPVEEMLLVDNNIFAAFYGEGIRVSSYPFEEWSLLEINDDYYTDFVALTHDKGNTLFAATLRGDLYAFDLGDNRQSNVSILPVSGYFENIYDIFYSDYFNRLFIGTNRGLFEYDFYSKTITSVMVDEKEYNSPIFTISELGDGIIAAGGRGHLLVHFENRKWRTTPIFTDNDILSLDTLGGVCFASTGGDHILFSEFGSGLTEWGRIKDRMSTTVIYDLLAINGVIYKATNGKGVFVNHSLDNKGIEKEEVKSMVVTGGEIFVGTRLNGIFRKETGYDKEDLHSVEIENLISLEGEKLIIDIFPNPASSFVKIDFDGNLKGVSKDIVLLNSEGKVVLERPNFLDDEIEIELSEFTRGVYSLVVNSFSNMLVRKIVIQ